MDNSTLKDQLIELKSKVDQVLTLKQTPDSAGTIKNFYATDVVDQLMQLRRTNRAEKDGLEERLKKAKELNGKLILLQEECDCLMFETACLSVEVDTDEMTHGMESDTETSAENGYLEAKVAHEARLRSLEDEEIKRRELMDKLSRLSENTKEIEKLCTTNSDQLNQVKPSIKQLLDKVSSTLNCSTTSISSNKASE